MLALERRNGILTKLHADKKVLVGELSLLYSVSEETIRRDLDKLEKEGYCVKSYGGAVLREDISIDIPFSIRKNHQINEKQHIAELAATLISEGEHIFLDASSTAVFVARKLKEMEHLTVITNALDILMELADMQGWNVICTGGEMKQGYLAFLGSKAEEAIRSCYADTVVFSCKALDIKMGMMESQPCFADVKKAMISHAGRKILAVDHSKFGKTSYAISSRLEDIDIVLTDTEPQRQWLDEFQRLGITCLW